MDRHETLERRSDQEEHENRLQMLTRLCTVKAARKVFMLRQVNNVALRSYSDVLKSCGIRDLKQSLSEHVREVLSGEAVQVTDCGEVVAELIRPGPRGAPWSF